MNFKKFLFSILILFLLLSFLTSCKKTNTLISYESNKMITNKISSEAHEEKKYTIDTSTNESVSEEQQNIIRNFLFKKFGKYDEDIGFELIFEIIEKTYINKEKFYIGRWKWIVEDENGHQDHSSLVTDFIINEDMTKMYECCYLNYNTLEWYPDNNLLDK